LFNVGFASYIVGDCGFVGVFGLELGAFLVTQLLKQYYKAYLFKLVHEGCGVDKALLVCIV
jgi:hypothetical protein